MVRQVRRVMKTRVRIVSVARNLRHMTVRTGNGAARPVRVRRSAGVTAQAADAGSAVGARPGDALGAANLYRTVDGRVAAGLVVGVADGAVGRFACIPLLGRVVQIGRASCRERVLVTV